MKRLGLLFSVMLLFSFVSPAFALDVEGILIDTACYKKDKSNSGVNHKMPAEVKDCAVACAKKGGQVGVLLDTGEVIFVSGALAENGNARLWRHMGRKVRVQGSVAVAPDGQRTILGGALKRLDTAGASQ